MTQAKDYLAASAPGVAARAIERLEATPPMVSYSDISYQTVGLDTAASAQSWASMYAPNAEVDSKNIERIEHQASQVKASMAMGPSMDGKSMALLTGKTAQESVAIFISQADSKMEHMRNVHALSLQSPANNMDAVPA